MKSPLWHPFTQHGLGMAEIPISHASGSYLYTPDGRAIRDGISSWWVNIYGHCHPKIVAAVQAQAARLEQVIFAGFTHEPAETLAEKLLRITGPSFTRVFLSDSGSTAVEVALKMSIGAWHNQGSPRTVLLALEDGYHGDTFGAMAVGARSVFSASYEPLLFDVVRLPFPEGDGSATLAALEAALARYPGGIAALILEPLVLGAGGMRMYAPEVFAQLARRCQQQGIHVIADEVMTGWGRTGTRFAFQQTGVTPDIICLSKGLTGGFLPLGATLASEAIYQSFYSTDRRKTFFHSSSFTGNPLSCAAANAAIDLWSETGAEEQIGRINAFHRSALAELARHPRVSGARCTGTIAAFEVRGGEAGYLAGIGPRLYHYFLEKNLLLRPLGNTVYLLPPYCFSNDDLEIAYDTIRSALDALSG